jgi:preprotein translocase subunit SecG
MNPYIVALLVVLFVVISALLMLVVLIQRPQGGGLSEAFGSASGSGHTAFGAKTGDALTTATIGIFVLFIGCAIGLNYAVRPPKAVTTPAEMAAPVTPDGSAPAGTAGTSAVPIQLTPVPAPGTTTGTTPTLTAEVIPAPAPAASPAGTPAGAPGTTPSAPATPAPAPTTPAPAPTTPAPSNP